MEGRGRVLLAHHDKDFRDWGASLTMSVGPGATGKGLALSLEPVWGDASSGVDALWQSDRMLWSDRGLGRERAENASWSPDRMNLELGYRLGVGRKLLTPFGDLEMEGAGSRRLRGGIRLEVPGAGRLRLELFGQQFVRPSESPGYAVQIRCAFDF